MNAYKHAELSVKRRGGKIEDYYPIHSFIDSTKELCSDNRHRIFHNLWGIRRVIIPLFGHTIINSHGKKINVKDLCEQDHVLPDYSNKFIPTLSDFIDQIDELTPHETSAINEIHSKFEFNSQESNLLLSPLGISGQLKSLLITHNSWFLNEIMPKIFNKPSIMIEFQLLPKLLFGKMNFATWMDNGSAGMPNSCYQIKELI